MKWDEVAQLVLAELSEQERRDSVVYLDERELPPGSTLTVDKKDIAIISKSAVGFVDKEPRANWGHDCRYLLISLVSGKIESIEAQFPPFLRGVPKTLRVIWKGETVPDWAIARP